ncbi:GtrA family protein [Herbihabitans rhizosphaerae]|uniref:GtrA family protein n=1 Tax=Herbihabitans rhizosphaerae TaxID=1872711 RepID=UPI001A90D6FD|nr:GtrA family protein [Herbihabitans rhizosphaerae]
MAPETEVQQQTERQGFLAQAIRFVLVGGFCAIIDFGVYRLCLALGLDAGIETDIARTISFIIGTVTAYFLNRKFTFNADGHSKAWGFAILYVLTYVAAVGMNKWMLAALPEGTWWTNLAWAISQGSATVVNFVVLRTVVYKQ